MKVFYSGFTGCDSMGFLSPGNDTRINLTFLMADAQHQALRIVPEVKDKFSAVNDYSPQDWTNFAANLTPETRTEGGTEGEGSVCVSDTKGGEQFLAAVAAAADIPNTEKKVLSESRRSRKCGAGGASAPQVQSAAAKDFAAYLSAIAHFYGDNHTDPSAFAGLANAGQPWVKEASRYMQARVLLLAAQANAFDEYGTMQRENIDAAAVAKALGALNAYLKDYPHGAYAQSATGLLRRCYWLADDMPKQAEVYGKLAQSSVVNQASIALVSELDFKLPLEAYTDAASNPMLLAVQDFRLMREQLDDKGKSLPGMKANVLEAQRQRFAAQPELFDYLLAARAWFIDKDAKAVLQLLPERQITADMSYLEFSRRLLRGTAFDATGDAKARGAYVAMMPFAKSAYQRNVLELAIALYDERHKNVGPLFDPNSPVQNALIRQQLLDYVAGPIILRQQATATAVSQEERDTAIYRLFSRDLVQGRFSGFLDDIKLLPPKPQQDASGQPQDTFEAFRWQGSKTGYVCPDLVAVAGTLNANARDVHGRMCLGEFFRQTETRDAVVDDKQALGGTGTLFAGKPVGRGEIYADIMKDVKAGHEDRAYALFRAVHCYEPVGSNACGGKDVPLAGRKGWYNELKKNYADTAWAKALRYYW